MIARIIPVFLCVAMAIATSASAVSYTVTVLHPVQFETSGGAAADGAMQVGGVKNDSPIDGYTHAYLWSGTAASGVDLNPTDFSNSVATGISGTTEVGFGSGPATRVPDTFTNPYHALMWNGTAASAVDLHPAGFDQSYATGASGANQVGYTTGPSSGFPHRAMLWTGTAASAVSLNPTGFANTEAKGISGTDQVGSGDGDATGGFTHALLWHGTAESFVDLNPPTGFLGSTATAASGATQVGFGNGTATANNAHALLWHGAAASAVDLNPAGYSTSIATGVVGTTQVGYGTEGAANLFRNHALLWKGTAASVVDLQDFLGPDFLESQASGITADGVVVGNATYLGGYVYAVIWTPVPEPSSCALTTGAVFVAFLLRRRRQV